jgi:hypothetical protein
MSINVDERMLEFNDSEITKFNDFVKTHVCDEKHRDMESIPLLCSIEIQGGTIGYWRTVKCELCGETQHLSE